MSDFTQRRLRGLLALVVPLLACSPPGDAAKDSPEKGGPNEPTDDTSGPQPSPTSAASSTGQDIETTALSSTSSTTDPGSATTTATSTGTTQAPMPERCGNGELDPGEQCDETYQYNDDAAACTSTCRLAFCGDGLVWAEMEQCDQGANNNDTTYSGCTEACAWGPRCGDGALQPEYEECDASAPPIEGLAPCDPSLCKFNARAVFVTSGKFSGALGGLALADSICAAAAKTQGLDSASTFKAWLSDGVASPQSRLKQAATDPGYPYVRLDGLLFADDLTDLITHGPKRPLDITETGATLPAQGFAWTNIGADGEPFSAVNHCKEWTSQALLATARSGEVSPASPAELPAWKNTRRWTSDASRPCQSLAHLYCFED